MLQKSLFNRQALVCVQRRFASTSDYHSLDDHIFYEPRHPVVFSGDRFSVFDNREASERRFAPYQMKELAFKNVMGISGTYVWLHLFPQMPLFELAIPVWMVNWGYQSWKCMSAAVRHVELHNDGKSLTIHPMIGSPVVAKIKDIKKLEHEKSLVETFEESFLFPIEVNGTKYLLHGNGHESIKHGEVFRAILNGQSIKL